MGELAQLSSRNAEDHGTGPGLWGKAMGTFSVISFIEATVVTSKWPLLRLKSTNRQSLTPRSMACWEAFITSARHRASVTRGRQSSEPHDLLSPADRTRGPRQVGPKTTGLYDIPQSAPCHILCMAREPGGQGQAQDRGHVRHSLPSGHLQNLPGASFTSISFTTSSRGPRIRTGRREVQSTFWTRW